MAMDFASARQRVGKLIAAKKPSDLSRSALTDDPLRDNIIDDAGKQAERFRHALKRKPEIEWEHENEDGTKEQKSYSWDGYGDAIKDVARAGFGFDDPKLRPAEQILASRQLNRELLSDYMRADEFTESRPYTEGNETESIFGALAASESLQESARTRLSEHIARSEEMREQEEQAQSAEEMFDNLRRRAREQHDAGEPVDSDVRRGLKQALKQMGQSQQALEDLLQQQAQSTFAQDVRAAADEAAQAADEAAEMFASLPGMEDGQARTLPLDQQIELAEKWANNPSLRAILEMLGRMFPRSKNAREARTKNVPGDPIDVTTGRDLEKLLPHELARAFIPGLRISFVKDFAEHALLQYELEGVEPLAHGPIVAVTDGSGSMSGEKFTWASSLNLTLLKLAQREGRTFAGVQFGSANEMASWIFPGTEDPDPEQVCDFAGHFFAGGTETAVGMAEALRIIREQPEFEHADVVLIGDGQDVFADEDQRIRDELRAMGVRINGLTILTGANPYFDQMCDWHADVTELAANDETDALVQELT